MVRARRTRREASGRFVLRLPPGLHAALRRAAQEAGSSLNDYCTRRLAAPGGNPTALRGASMVVERAAALLGERLIGVVTFGSWARGEAADTSDVDVLIVVEAGVPLARALYRAWDETPVTWEGRPVEPHFVHQPSPEGRVGSIWGEVAIDGVVLFERGVLVSDRLARVRRDILTGRLVRRIVHGQPYWAEVA